MLWLSPEPAVECFLEVVVHVSPVLGAQLMYSRIIPSTPVAYRVQEAKDEGIPAMLQSHTQLLHS